MSIVLIVFIQYFSQERKIEQAEAQSDRLWLSCLFITISADSELAWTESEFCTILYTVLTIFSTVFQINYSINSI